MDKKPNKLGDIFDKHIEFEFDKEDVNATVTTMTDGPICSSSVIIPLIKEGKRMILAAITTIL